MAIYSHMDHRGRTVTFRDLGPGGIRVWANPDGVHIPDDEIPALISKLQAYMSARAREVARGAK